MSEPKIKLSKPVLDEDGIPTPISIDNDPVNVDLKPDVTPDDPKVDDPKVDNLEPKVDPIDPKPDAIDYSKLEKVTIQTDDGEKELFISDKGDYIDENNSVVYTKDQVEEEANDEFEQFFEGIEIKPLDETGEPKSYTNDIEGIKSYAKDLYDKGINETLESNNQDVFISQLYEKYPIVSDIISHIDRHGSITDFDLSVDINSTISEDNLEGQRTIVRKDRLAKGETQEEANNYIKYLEDNEKLFVSSKDIQTRVQQSKVDNEAYAAQAQFDDHVGLWGINPKTGKPTNVEGSIYDIVSNGKDLKIGENVFSIPDNIRVKENNTFVPKTKKDFFEFLYTPKVFEANGQKVSMSGYQFKLAQRDANKTINDDLYEAYTMFTNTNPILEESNEFQKYNKVKKKLIVKGGTNSKAPGAIKLKVKRQS